MGRKYEAARGAASATGAKIAFTVKVEDAYYKEEDDVDNDYAYGYLKSDCR